MTEEVGAIVVATGFQLYDIGREQPTGLKGYGEYGYGEVPDVIDGMQFERLASASGPTGGAILRPSDGKEPKTIVFVQVRRLARPREGHRVLLQDLLHVHGQARDALPAQGARRRAPSVFYMDIRAAGKGYDEFSRRAIEEDGAEYIRGRVSRIFRDGDMVQVWGFDTLSGEQVVIDADMVVLATADAAAAGDRRAGADALGVATTQHGFINEAHPKLRPVETNTAGVFVAGACQAPRDIPESVAMASATAAKVMALFSADELEREPAVAIVNEQTCIGCMHCQRSAPTARSSRTSRAARRAALPLRGADVNPGVCQGCGTCQAVCPSKSVELETLHRRTDLLRDQRPGAVGVRAMTA